MIEGKRSAAVTCLIHLNYLHGPSAVISQICNLSQHVTPHSSSATLQLVNFFWLV